MKKLKTDRVSYVRKVSAWITFSESANDRKTFHWIFFILCAHDLKKRIWLILRSPLKLIEFNSVDTINRRVACWCRRYSMACLRRLQKMETLCQPPLKQRRKNRIVAVRDEVDGRCGAYKPQELNRWDSWADVLYSTCDTFEDRTCVNVKCCLVWQTQMT